MNPYETLGVPKTATPDLLRCSFCHKNQDIVGKLISHSGGYPRAYICDECIAVCNSILEDDRMDYEEPQCPSLMSFQLETALL